MQIYTDGCTVYAYAFTETISITCTNRAAEWGQHAGTCRRRISIVCSIFRFFDFSFLFFGGFVLFNFGRFIVQSQGPKKYQTQMPTTTTMHTNNAACCRNIRRSDLLRLLIFISNSVKHSTHIYGIDWHRLNGGEGTAGGEIRIRPTQPCHVRIER